MQLPPTPGQTQYQLLARMTTQGDLHSVAPRNQSLTQRQNYNRNKCELDPSAKRRYWWTLQLDYPVTDKDNNPPKLPCPTRGRAGNRLDPHLVFYTTYSNVLRHRLESCMTEFWLQLPCLLCQRYTADICTRLLARSLIRVGICRIVDFPSYR